MKTGTTIAGSGESGVIVCTPVPGMLNEIAVTPALVLALVIAWRSDPVPLSFVLITSLVGIEGNVSDGGVFSPVFDETDLTVTVTGFVTTGQLGNFTNGQNGWMPSFGGASPPVNTSLSIARSVNLRCSPGPTRIVVLVGA